MSGMLWWLLAAFAVPLLLAIAALTTPAKINFTMHTSPRWRVKIAARLFGGLTPPIPIHDSARRRQKRNNPTAKKKSFATVSRQAMAKIPRVVGAAPQLLTGLIRPIHLERLSVDAIIGLSDPADTGQLFGLIAAVDYSQSRTSAVSVAVRPDFAGPRATGELYAELSLIPITFIPPGVRFAYRLFGSH